MNIREAALQDVPDLVKGVAALLRELSGREDYEMPDGVASVFERLIIGRTEGAVFVAEDQGALIAFLTLTLQEATRYGGSYAQIQELWVAAANRGSGIGTALLARTEDWCRAREIWPLEIGLPTERFSGFERTLGFYKTHGFDLIGPRVRKLLT